MSFLLTGSANPRDPTVWRLSRSDRPPAEVLVPGGDCDFGVCYPETATTNRVQPKSGAVNILESYLAAREVVPTAPVSPLTAVWEPGYDCSTGYSDRTIEVRGNLADTDEWDDDVLLHEFGHYLMHEFAQIPSGYDPGHKWHLSDTAYPNTAYIEGWADFFSGAARIGSAADSLYVDNESIGSSTLTLWVNLEDPWIGSEYNPSDFQRWPLVRRRDRRCSLGHLRCPRRDSLSILS